MCPQPPANGTAQFHSQVIWPQSTEDILLVKFQSKFQGLNEDLSTSVLLTFGPAILCLYLLEASGTHTFPRHIHTSVDEKNVSSHRPLSPGSKNLPTWTSRMASLCTATVPCKAVSLGNWSPRAQEPIRGQVAILFTCILIFNPNLCLFNFIQDNSLIFISTCYLD